MIKLENIQKVFRTEEVETWALREVNLEVKEGEFVAIMGPSGCGKSTLLNILGLLDNPTNGTYTLNVFDKPDEQSQDSLGYAMAKKRLSKTNVFAKPDEQSYAMAKKRLCNTNVFAKPDEQSQDSLSYAMAKKRLSKTNGKDVSQLKENERTDLRKGVIGFVFQSFNLIDELNVYENIELPLLYMGVPAKERKRRIEAVMDRMAISHRRNHFPNQLSGGQQQRVAIARAVISNPKIILADEPTGNLDSQNGKEVMQLLSDLHKEGATIIMVTHSQHDAAYADRIINLYDGQIVKQVEL